MTSQSMRGFNADDARSLAGNAGRHVAEFVVADVLRQAEAAARDSRHCLQSHIDAGQLSDEECEAVANTLNRIQNAIDIWITGEKRKKDKVMRLRKL